MIYPVLLSSVNPVPDNDGLLVYVSLPPPPSPLTGLNGVTAASTTHVFVAISSIASIGKAFITIILKDPEAESPSLSVTVTAYVLLTLTDGVPEINPPLIPLEVIDNPEGKLGLIVYDTYDPLPPVTFTLLNVVISRFLVNDQLACVGVITNGGFKTLNVKVCCVVCFAPSVAIIVYDVNETLSLALPYILPFAASNSNPDGRVGLIENRIVPNPPLVMVIGKILLSAIKVNL